MENNLSFSATLTNIQPIPGADKIKTASVTLKGVPITQVVVGADTEENTPVLYFDANLCVEQAFIDKIDKLSPQYGKEGFKSLSEYLAKNGRVRAIKLKGVISNGLAVEMSKVMKAYQLPNLPDEGFASNEINGEAICRKYAPPVDMYSTASGANRKKVKGKEGSRIVEGQFAFHIDTLQLARNLHMLNPKDVVSISSKWHGTSVIISNCLTKKKLNPLEKVLKFLHLPVTETVYDYIFASRKVVKNNSTTGYYREDIWSKVGKEFFVGKLKQGETVYAEIVGYLSDGKFIQKNYTYGCSPGEYAVRIYRMTKTGPDGDIVEYSWPKIKSRCKEMNVKMVDEFYYGRLQDLYPEIVLKGTTDEDLDAWRLDVLAHLTADYLEKDIPGANGKLVPDEGIVIKVENGGETALKLKSAKFFVHETKMMEQGEVDTEESSGEAS